MYEVETVGFERLGCVKGIFIFQIEPFWNFLWKKFFTIPPWTSSFTSLCIYCAVVELHYSVCRKYLKSWKITEIILESLECLEIPLLLAGELFEKLFLSNGPESVVQSYEEKHQDTLLIKLIRMCSTGPFVCLQMTLLALGGDINRNGVQGGNTIKESLWGYLGYYGMMPENK